MEILVTIGYIIACVLAFAFAILIHEFGHFIVALKLGLKVERFSIGFGPAIWKKTVDGIEYRISWLPLGGYVAIPDLDPEGTKAIEGSGEKKVKGEGEQRSIDSDAGKKEIPAWKEILVAAAGPLMNVVLAVALAFALSLAPGAKFGVLPSVIGAVEKDGPAAKAGIQAGDVVVAIGGRPIKTWTEMQTEVQISRGREVEFVVRRGEEELSIPVTPTRNEVSGAYYIMALSLTNGAGSVAWMPARSPWEQLEWDAGGIFRILKGLVTPKETRAVAGALGGPVMIAEGIYRSFRRDVWDGVGFLRFLNVNLAILNLLPLPVLDGGLIFFALIALVFRRRIPKKVITALSMVFMYALMGLMALLIMKDAWRSWKIHTYKPVAEEKVKVKGEGEQRTVDLEEKAESDGEDRGEGVKE